MGILVYFLLVHLLRHMEAIKSSTDAETDHLVESESLGYEKPQCVCTCTCSLPTCNKPPSPWGTAAPTWPTSPRPYRTPSFRPSEPSVVPPSQAFSASFSVI